MTLTGSAYPSTREAISAPPGRLRARFGRLRQLAGTNVWMVVLLVVMVTKADGWFPLLKGLPVLESALVATAIAFYLSRVSGALAPVRVRSIPLARLAIAFLTLSIVSILFSIYRTQTLLASYLSVILLISFLLLLKATQTIRDVERLLIGLAVAGSSLSIAALVGYHGGRAHIGSAFDPNELAYSLVTLVPIVLVLSGSRWGWRRLLMMALVLFMCGAVLLTASRGGTLGLLLVLLAVCAFPLDLGRSGNLKGFHPARSLVRLGIVALLGTLVLGSLPGTPQERLLSLRHLQERRALWTRDIDLALQRPIGYGMGTAATVGMIYGHDSRYLTAHNSVIQAFLELGAVGVYLFLASYYVAWRDLGRTSAARPRDGPDDGGAKAALYARALRVALLGNLTAGFFLSQAYSASLWMTMGVCCALSRIAAVNDAEPAARPRREAIRHTLSAWWRRG